MWSRDKAREHYRQERFKLELVEAIPDGEEVSFYRRAIFWIYAVVRTCVTPAIPAPLFGLPMLPAVIGAAIPANRSYKGFTAPLGARRVN